MIAFLIIILMFVYLIRYLNKKDLEIFNQRLEMDKQIFDKYKTINSNPHKNFNINQNSEFSNYITNGYIMTPTELKFYRELKKVTDRLGLIIFTQVNLERIISVSDSNYTDRNKIKSRSIDFSIVNNKNCKLVCCIELDDYYHNREVVKKTDKFKDNLFEYVKIPLHRVKVNRYYNLNELEIMLKRDMLQDSVFTLASNM